MNNLYKIIKALQSASGSNAKLAILQENKANNLLKEYLRVTYDPSINYWQKSIGKFERDWSFPPSGVFGFEDIDFMLNTIASRRISGKAAERGLAGHSAALTTEGQELIQYILDRSIGSSVGDTMILKVWPDLYFIPGYMRCSLFTPKIKKHFESLKELIVQKKADGSFCYLKKASDGASTGFTRAGSHYPAWLVEKLLAGSPNGNFVYVGELLVYKNRKLLDRQTGNGIYNSILKGADEAEFADCSFLMEAWDLLPTCDFEGGLCEIEYRARLETLEIHSASTENIDLIETDFVESLAAAYKIYSHYTSEGFEGAVVKDGTSCWKNHTSPFNVKLKIAFEIDLEITHVIEGIGKAQGMMGAVGVKSLEGILQSDVGTGWSDEDRRGIWSIRKQIVGSILTVKANDIISNRNSDGKSLFLPVAVELRNDKFVADSYEHCVAQLNAAKGL